MKHAWKSAAAAVALSLAAVGAARADGEVNVYNWSDYWTEDAMAIFTDRTGVSVNYDVFDSGPAMAAKLLAGQSGYDVAFPAFVEVPRLIQSGAIQPVDPSQVENYDLLDPAIMAQMRAVDPGNQYGVPYMYGTIVIGYNVAKVTERLGEVPSGWSTLFDPENAAKLADCGITLFDDPNEMFPAVLAYLGMDPNAKDDASLQAVGEALAPIRPYIRDFVGSGAIELLASGEVCAAMAYNGDALQARDRAAEAGAGVEVNAYYPEDGIPLWIDVMTIPTGAPNVDNAYALMGYLSETDVAAKNTEYVYFASANLPSKDKLDPEVANDPLVFVPDALKDKLYLAGPPSPRQLRTMTRIWTGFKTGG